ncbi:TPA: hypothetical protein CPT90_09465 [Candidatus Gastranaerophilales bacterium HUM_3]|nr:MAG TPA: hypothetical protein CPT90_09465 [Candidatus Gastranaerophilales bacterium HUM_3]DAA99086.1 MAG TPA: hypothetical protein CPT89_11430 [Candidatus Gastranaerophilales bacterium HUM_11]DAB11688.1 MAG TPA: hypothetical protein CPT91_03875 [Candidatus Gastranaerophilales bacterium HUM_16]
MKIQAINTNTNFKGLFTDKSAQNNGNWRMEYQPYSWESNNTGKMANKERIDIYANMLPDNEEIYTKNKGYYAETSGDILGTTSYYKTYDGRMRRTIDEMPAMNREDSLKVLDKKLGKFLEQKQELRKELEANFDRQTLAIRSSSDNYNIASYELDNTFWTKKNIKNNMDNAARELKNNADIMYQNSQNYIKLMGSIDAVRQTKENGQKEIKQLEELRKSGKLIDISRRDIPNPNEALKQALADIRAAAGKFLCLPHKLMSMEEVLKIVNPRNLSSGYNNEIMHHIEKLIKRTV